MVYRLEAAVNLSKNSTVREQTRCVYDFLEVLENKIDHIISQRRQEENKSLVSFDSEASYKKDVKKFAIRDITEIFPDFGD